ncbi:D-alanyl-D-alanine carboxypeptidase/D-alanyl-D-alanine-endopeptidase [Actinomycetaceae bacterium L2_0104]
MNRKTQVAVTALLALGGTYFLADAFDLTPGLITTRPVEEKAASYPSADPVSIASPQLPSLDEEAAVPSADDVQAAIDELLANPQLTGQASIEIVDAATGEVLGGANTDVARMPASNQKLLTATVALEVLGPQSTLETTAALADGTLYLVGGGDAMLAAGHGDPDSIMGHAGLADLADQTAENLKESGTTAVDLAVDSSLFTGPLYHPEVVGSDTSYIMQMRPIAVELSHDSEGAFTADPDLQALDAFAAALKERGIAANVIGREQAPTQALEVGAVESASIRELVDHMLTDSCNTTADILGHLVALAEGESGDFEGAARATTSVLKEMGYTTAGITVSDNSGMSILNRLTTAIQIEILDDVYTCEECNLEAIASGLPVAGLNGTLSTRMTELDLGGRVRAKTGTLIMANSLSGFMMTEGGRVLSFSVLVDNIEEGTTREIRTLIDDFLGEIAAL